MEDQRRPSGTGRMVEEEVWGWRMSEQGWGAGTWGLMGWRKLSVMGEFSGSDGHQILPGLDLPSQVNTDLCKKYCWCMSELTHQAGMALPQAKGTNIPLS